MLMNVLSGEGTGNNYAYLVSAANKEAVIIDPAHPSEYVPRKVDDALENATVLTTFLPGFYQSLRSKAMMGASSSRAS
jgi:hypothetical protein